MTAEEIRRIDVSHDTPATQAAFGLSMLQEIAAQLADLNRKLDTYPVLRQLDAEMGGVDSLVAAIHQSNSIVPYLYPAAPANARRV